MEAVDFIEIVFRQRIRFSKIIAAEYRKGLSLSEIAIKLDKSKWFVRTCLSKEGIKLRNKYAEAMALRKLMRGKQGARPYYGFCYFDGQIIKDPREYPILAVIHDLWKEGKTIHRIVLELNSRKLLSRNGRLWSWAAVSLIVARFKQRTIEIN